MFGGHLLSSSTPKSIDVVRTLQRRQALAGWDHRKTDVACAHSGGSKGEKDTVTGSSCVLSEEVFSR